MLAGKKPELLSLGVVLETDCTGLHRSILSILLIRVEDCCPQGLDLRSRHALRLRLSRDKDKPRANPSKTMPPQNIKCCKDGRESQKEEEGESEEGPSSIVKGWRYEAVHGWNI